MFAFPAYVPHMYKEETMQSRDVATTAVLRYFEGVWNARHLDLIDELLAPTFVGYERNATNTYGPAGMRQAANMFFHRFPDATFTILDTIAEGDVVVLHLRFQGTHSASGRPICVTGMGLFRLVDGKITESWSNWDELGMSQQLGGRVVFDIAPA
jgi:predicted ester cyclase